MTHSVKNSVAATSRRSRNCSLEPRTPKRDDARGNRRPRTSEVMVADTLCGGGENVQAAQAPGAELVAPIPGREPEKNPVALTLDDFATDERTGRVETCLEQCENGNAERARR
jgi:hypothetical protein